MKHCQFNQREQKIQIGRKSGIRNWPLLTKMNRAHRQYMHVQCTHTHNGRKKNRHSVTHIQNAVYTQSIFICSIFIFNHLSAFGPTIHIFVYLFARKPAHDAESEFASKLTSESSTLTRTLIASSH